ncbi:hypothetical protein XM38_023240 [Halomicronema hongdechloris C2206]|uniref:Uncharacterized protein n=1 Tax=Halomicronema hongdechloris C2206 TaxID=1641165 RepID=A0A1Z3HM27_9CYAN|nr:hypothetical protein [Halomicronema hongdechloris]ASC71372.1 hypothetical protein XM38_023240 [Halomicronema hongdechloris C2206]
MENSATKTREFLRQYQRFSVRPKSLAAAYDPPNAKGLGYTHLIDDAKRDANIAARLERRVAQAYVPLSVSAACSALTRLRA